jgi:hypothetical protein
MVRARVGTGRSTRPVRLDIRADRLLTEASALLRRTKTDLLTAAVHVYVEQHREQLERALRAAEHRISEAERIPTASIPRPA